MLAQHHDVCTKDSVRFCPESIEVHLALVTRSILGPGNQASLRQTYFCGVWLVSQFSNYLRCSSIELVSQFDNYLWCCCEWSNYYRGKRCWHDVDSISYNIAMSTISFEVNNVDKMLSQLHCSVDNVNDVNKVLKGKWWISLT